MSDNPLRRSEFANLRDSALGDLRRAAVRNSAVNINVPQLQGMGQDFVKTQIMEAALEAIRNQPGFDPTVAGSASFKLRW